MIHTQDVDFTLLCGDVLDELATLPDESVHCVVTSPPYWGLRDYGTGEWDGGNPDCDHQRPKQQDRTFKSGAGVDGRNCLSWTERDGSTYLDVCGKCGAHRQDKQLGLEPTPDQYVARKHGRRSIGIELNPAYAELAAKRMQQQSLFALEGTP